MNEARTDMFESTRGRAGREHGRRGLNATGHRRPTSSEPLVAVCLSGALRTFLQPPVQRAFSENLHYQGYEYFVSTDRPRPAPELLVVSPVRSWSFASGCANDRPTKGGDGIERCDLDRGRPNSAEKDQLPRGRCPRGTCNPFRFLQPFAARHAECYYAIQSEEGASRIRYATVLRLRPDHIVLRRLPRVSETGWLGQPLVPRRVLLWDDQWALSRRDDAASMLLSPALVYGTCADEAQWRQATLAGDASVDKDWTMAKCRDVGDVPTGAMTLLSVLGGLSSWRELPLVARSWGPHGSRGWRRSEDFCLKRERFVNETPGRAAHPHAGLSC
jgi:hypothetical protein